MKGGLVGVAEIADMLGGVTRQRVDQLARTHEDFPAPVAELASGRVWSKEAIARWVRRHLGPSTGRPMGRA